MSAPNFRSLAILSLFAMQFLGEAKASTTINKVTYDSSRPSSVVSTPSADASLKLKRVFLFPSLDDVSGVLSPKLDEKLVQLFRRNSRFDLVIDPQVMKALSPNDGAYAKAALSPEVHKEAARVTGSDSTSILRTKNIGNDTEMTLELRDSSGELLFSESGTIPGFSAMEARWGLTEKLFQAVLSKIPFDGTITGRSASTLTLDLGAGSVLQGEEVDLVRIVSIQRHPLLRTVVGTDYVRVGRATVTRVDRTISFAELNQEYPGEAVSTGAKVLRSEATRISRGVPGDQPRSASGGPSPAREAERDPFEDRLQGEFDRRKPRYGQVGANLQYGSLTHSQTAGGALREYSGGGIGVGLNGELWITRHWIVSVGYGFQSATLSGDAGVLGDSTWKKFEGFGGYRFFPSELIDGIQLTGKLGYQSHTFSVPNQAGVAMSGKRYTSVALQLDGEFAFHPNHKLTGGFGFQPFSSLTDEGASPGVADGGTVIGFHLGWNYRLSDLFWSKVGIEFDTASGNYSNNANVNNKRFAIGPGITYLF